MATNLGFGKQGYATTPIATGSFRGNSYQGPWYAGSYTPSLERLQARQEAGITDPWQLKNLWKDNPWGMSDGRVMDIATGKRSLAEVLAHGGDTKGVQYTPQQLTEIQQALFPMLQAGQVGALDRTQANNLRRFGSLTAPQTAQQVIPESEKPYYGVTDRPDVLDMNPAAVEARRVSALRDMISSGSWGNYQPIPQYASLFGDQSGGGGQQTNGIGTGTGNSDYLNIDPLANNGVIFTNNQSGTNTKRKVGTADNPLPGENWVDMDGDGRPDTMVPAGEDSGNPNSTGTGTSGTTTSSTARTPFALSAVDYRINPILGQQFDNLATLPKPGPTGMPFWAAQAPTANQLHGFYPANYFPGQLGGESMPHIAGRGTNLGFGTMYGYPMGGTPQGVAPQTQASGIRAPTNLGFTSRGYIPSVTSAPPARQGQAPGGTWEGGGTGGGGGGNYRPGTTGNEQVPNTLEGGGTGGGGTGGGGAVDFGPVGNNPLPASGTGTMPNLATLFANLPKSANLPQTAEGIQQLLRSGNSFYTPFQTAVQYSPDQIQKLYSMGVPLQLGETSNWLYGNNIYETSGDNIGGKMTPQQYVSMVQALQAQGLAMPREANWLSKLTAMPEAQWGTTLNPGTGTPWGGTTTSQTPWWASLTTGTGNG